ncbi:uncharacterized protein LOC119835871 [Zerene cesonia]|uniref:uncharacterized protein LOC119835871 n=1 Tax=Zerene cesonia TaxID=33412 RepID=UPI0018E593B9|nr:uncharacterized protein LOC119835871 [Zerene cesonia]
MVEMWKVIMKPGLSMQLVNLAIIGVCLVSKVPQISNLQNRRPSEIKAVSAHGIIMEIVGYTIMSMYNYKNDYNVLTYLEYPAILVQAYFMLFYVLRAKNQHNSMIIPPVTVLYAVSIILFMTEVIPKEVLNFIVPICTPLSGFAKVCYIISIVQTKNAEAVSWETWAMSVLTNGARLFCVYVDSGDMNLLLNYFVSVILSAGVLATAIYFQLNPAPRPVICTRRREPSVRRHYHME